MSSPAQGTVRRSDLKALKTAYRTALNNKQEQFTFQGSVLVTNYAKYLIEYMELPPRHG